MIYRVFLREGDNCSLISTDNDESWPPPNPGDEWPVTLDEKEIRCIVVELGHPSLDGQTILSQDLFVRRPHIPKLKPR